ncbi:hypothetical protein B4U80_08093, partial [Leptotrombidium deliense]
MSRKAFFHFMRFNEITFLSSHSVDLILNFTSNKAGTEWNGAFFFIHATDPQFGCYANLKRDVHNFEHELNNSVRLINIVNEMRPKPRFLVLTGDFSDEWPGSDKVVRKRQMDAFNRTFSKLGTQTIFSFQIDKEIELILVCGNHDVGMIPKPSVIDEYRRRYGDDYYVYTTGGVMFVVINTSYLYLEINDLLASKQYFWLRRVLSEKDARIKHVVVFQHVP